MLDHYYPAHENVPSQQSPPRAIILLPQEVTSEGQEAVDQPVPAVSLLSLQESLHMRHAPDNDIESDLLAQNASGVEDGERGIQLDPSGLSPVHETSAASNRSNTCLKLRKIFVGLFRLAGEAVHEAARAFMLNINIILNYNNNDNNH